MQRRAWSPPLTLIGGCAFIARGCGNTSESSEDRRPTSLERRSRCVAAACDAFEMLDHLVDMHYVGIFVMEVEQIDLVAQHRAVIGAFLDDDVVEAVGISIDRAGAHATRRAFAEDDQAAGADLAQLADQRRAEEARRGLL